jgi:glucoamylase
MATQDKHAFGKPGLPPAWTASTKEAVGTAYSTASRVWFTLAEGIITECYYPTIDHPQIRDLQFLVADGQTFFHEEKRDMLSELEPLEEHTLGYVMTSKDPAGRYALTKNIICDPHLPCILVQAQFRSDPGWKGRLRLYALLAPHLGIGGWNNYARVLRVAGQSILLAWQNQTFVAMAASNPFSRLSCGYVGASDGWQDLYDNYQMDWEFGAADSGNVALTGEIDLSKGSEFTLGIAFGEAEHAAITTLLQSLSVPINHQRQRFLEQWHRVCCNIAPLEAASGDNGQLYRISHNVLLAHEDKTYGGAFIASASIPWGDAKGSEDLGGYHLVWTRDMVNTATALLACGRTETARRALVYLASSQQPDGSFPQNFWLDGTPYWRGVQLDEVAFPIVLAWRMWKAGALAEFDPYPMVKAAAAFLVRQGPTTQQERWEENSGYSPSTLAISIAGLICAADFTRARGESAIAWFLEDYADFIESHLERWTVTTQGSLVPHIARHYIRILPFGIADVSPSEDPNRGILPLGNQPPGQPWQYPAKEIVDAGFLELVRYGIRPGGDPLIEQSLAVVDAILKVETPYGPCWHRYNHDGYGQRPDGGPYIGWGKGRAWPLLTGERGHYELAAGRDPRPYLRAVEGLASQGGMLPEQVWDEVDMPGARMYFGKPTGSAMPLVWAHAEYIKLLRSAHEGRVFDCIPAVADRYLSSRGRKDLEVWKPIRQVKTVRTGQTLRVQAPRNFRLHWSRDEWQTTHDTEAIRTGLGIAFVDIPTGPSQIAPIRFSFFWTNERRWEGCDYKVEIQIGNARSEP